jgi:hypothetical protein
MNKLILLLILIKIIFVIYYISKKHTKRKNNFVKKEDYNMQYNLYKIYNKNVIIPSSQILKWMYDFYEVPNIIYDYTLDVQNEMGVNNTIWAMKKTNGKINNDKINWEYYFYGLNLNGERTTRNLYKYNKKLHINNYYNKIHKKYFPKEDININELNKYENKLIIYSVDVEPKYFEDKKIGNIDIYLHEGNNENIEMPYHCSCHSFNNNIKLKGDTNIYIMSDKNQRNIVYNTLRKYIDNPNKILLNNWEKIINISLCDKIYSNCISINYFGFDIDTFIMFLNKHNYNKQLIDNVIKNKDKLKTQSFEISEDYNKDTLQVVKTTIYGSF